MRCSGSWHADGSWCTAAAAASHCQAACPNAGCRAGEHGSWWQLHCGGGQAHNTRQPMRQRGTAKRAWCNSRGQRQQNGSTAARLLHGHCVAAWQEPSARRRHCHAAGAARATAVAQRMPTRPRSNRWERPPHERGRVTIRTLPLRCPTDGTVCASFCVCRCRRVAGLQPWGLKNECFDNGDSVPPQKIKQLVGVRYSASECVWAEHMSGDSQL